MRGDTEDENMWKTWQLERWRVLLGASWFVFYFVLFRPNARICIEPTGMQMKEQTVAVENEEKSEISQQEGQGSGWNRWR